MRRAIMPPSCLPPSSQPRLRRAHVEIVAALGVVSCFLICSAVKAAESTQPGIGVARGAELAAVELAAGVDEGAPAEELLRVRGEG